MLPMRYGLLPKTSGIFAPSTAALTPSRSVSSKHPIPKPRPYRRRWFEAAVMPVMPEVLKVCVPPEQRRQQRLAEQAEVRALRESISQYSDIELALAEHVRKWMANEQFRVMGICQFLPVKARVRWFDMNQFRLKNIEFRNYSRKIMRKVFEKTSIRVIDPIFDGNNGYLFGRDLESLRIMVTQCEKFPYLIPLLFVVDDRIVSVKEAKELASLASLEDVRASTVALLSSQLSALSTTLDAQKTQLVSSLDHHVRTSDGTKEEKERKKTSE